MAFSQGDGFDTTMQVSANASSIAQFCAVTIDGSGNPGDVIYPSGSDVFCLGVNQDQGTGVADSGSAPPDAAIGQSIRVKIIGITKARAAGAITAGAYVAVSGAAGKFAAKTFPGTGATNTYIAGIALTGATAADDFFTLLLLPGLTTQVSS